MQLNKEELLNLPLEDRKELASELIDSILADETKLIPDWKKKMLQERLQYHADNPGNGQEWDELKKKFGR